MELGRADAGGSFTVAVGERVLISLPQNGSTGYVWQIVRLDGPGSVVEDRVDAGGSAPGAAGTRRLTIAADAPGTVLLRAVHAQPWQPAETTTDEYEVRLDAHS